jgi:hypothetical protein
MGDFSRVRLKISDTAAQYRSTSPNDESACTTTLKNTRHTHQGAANPHCPNPGISLCSHSRELWKSTRRDVMPLKSEELPLMTLGELTQAMSGQEGDRVLMAKAEMLRRQTQAQLDACAAQQSLRVLREECELHALLRNRLGGFGLRNRSGNGHCALHVLQLIDSGIAGGDAWAI